MLFCFWEWPPLCGVQIGKHSETNNGRDKSIYVEPKNIFKSLLWEETTPSSVSVNTAVSILVHFINICFTLAATCSEKDKKIEEKLALTLFGLFYSVLEPTL